MIINATSARQNLNPGPPVHTTRQLTTELHHSPPIDTLPNELLLEIFRFCVGQSLDYIAPVYLGTFEIDFEGNCEDEWPRIDTAQLISLTHVCVRWRFLLLDCPEFWTCIDGHNIAQFTAFVQRSKSLPLSLAVCYEDTELTREREGSEVVVYRPDVAALVSPLLARLKTVDIVVEDYPPTWIFQEYPPLLEVFNFCVHEGEIKFTSETPLLFNTQVLPLTALAISGLSGPDLPLNELPNLTHLYLSMCSFDDVPPENILGLLSRTPNLEVFHFDCVSVPEAEDPDELPLVSLPQLQGLSFSYGDMGPMFYLVPYLEFPDTVLIRCHVASPPTEGRRAIHCIPLTYIPLLCTSTVLELRQRMDRVILVLACPTSYDYTLLCTFTDTATDWPGEWLPELDTHLPLEGLTRVRVDLPFQTAPVLAALLPHMYALEELAVDEPDLPSLGVLVAALAPADLGASVPCPALRALTLTSCSAGGGGARVDAADAAALAEDLIRVLALRAAVGRRVARVVVQPMRRSEQPGEEWQDARFSRVRGVFESAGVEDHVESFEVLGPDADVFGGWLEEAGWLLVIESDYWNYAWLSGGETWDVSDMD